MILTKENFLLFAAKHYDNHNCSSIEEFNEDLMKFKYLRKLLYNYKKKDVLRERLILNHIVILYNIFETNACTKMLFLKLYDYKEVILPFIEQLNYVPSNKVITGIYDSDFYIKIDDIEKDTFVVEKIDKITRKKHG